MNMSQRTDDIDIQPDVLKFKQVWDSMNETTKQKQLKLPPQQQPKPTKNKYKNISKNTQQLPSQKQPTKNKPKPKPKIKQHSKSNKKQTVIISQKNINKNKHPSSSQPVVQIVTEPQGYYHDSLKNQKNNLNQESLIQTALNPCGIVQISQLTKAVQDKDHQLSLLRIANNRNQDRIRSLQKQLLHKQQRICQLQSRQRQLLSRNSILTGSQKLFDYGKVQYQNFRTDTRRLLKMLQTTSQYQQFSTLALDDGGIRFLNQVNKTIKSSLDHPQKPTLHFCTCNKQFIPQSGFWVPQKIYTYGKQFIKQRNQHLTSPQLQLLLYDLNKIWRQRQKRIINTLNSQKAKQINQIKRKIGQKEHLQHKS